MQTNVLDYLENAVEKYPEKIVFADENAQITYREFCQLAKIAATNLGEIIGKELRRPIVVLIDRDVSSVLCFFSVIYSGNFYVPIDGNLPQDRIRKMIALLDPVAILYHEKTKDAVEKIEKDVEKVRLEDILCGKEDMQYLNAVKKQSLDTDPLYAIFTSGSTGVPKGVVISHHSVIDLADQFQSEFSFDENCVWGNQAPFDFDVSVKDIYSTIKNGGTMHIIPKKLFMLPIKLMDYLNERKINTIIWAVSALVIIANLKTFDKIKPQYLKNVMFSGEVLPSKILNYWRNALPNVSYVNLYGPTEITCNCTFYKVNRNFDDTEVLPIGKPFANTGIILLDSERKKQVPFGEKGEICILGSSLALGYYNNPEKTQEAFIQNPLQNNYQERIYCTGDLAQYDENGDLLFLSRRDYQIKHMGHRIELGEIEVIINALPFIERAACVYDEANNKIVLFYQAKNDYKEQIIQALDKALPKYMWPNVYRQYEQLPMNKNAKIDRVKLKSFLLDC